MQGDKTIIIKEEEINDVLSSLDYLINKLTAAVESDLLKELLEVKKELQSQKETYTKSHTEFVSLLSDLKITLDKIKRLNNETEIIANKLKNIDIDVDKISREIENTINTLTFRNKIKDVMYSALDTAISKTVLAEEKTNKILAAQSKIILEMETLQDSNKKLLKLHKDIINSTKTKILIRNILIYAGILTVGIAGGIIIKSLFLS